MLSCGHYFLHFLFRQRSIKLSQSIQRRPFVPDKIGYCRSVCYFFISLRETAISQIFNGVIFGRSCRGANVFILSKVGPRNRSLVGNKRWLLLRGSKVVVANGGRMVWSLRRGQSLLGEVVNRSCTVFILLTYAMIMLHFNNHSTANRAKKKWH